MLHGWQGRSLVLHALSTGVGLTCSTRAVSRLPLVFIALSPLCCLTAGDGPA
jgi:hypothetical protein